ncbi:MAG: hypothetical protein AB1351_00810 [Thermoproteota archaeon]
MGFFDRFRKKKEATTTEQAKTEQAPTEKKIKAYTSDGKPVYE